MKANLTNQSSLLLRLKKPSILRPPQTRLDVLVAPNCSNVASRTSHKRTRTAQDPKAYKLLTYCSSCSRNITSLGAACYKQGAFRFIYKLYMSTCLRIGNYEHVR